MNEYAIDEVLHVVDRWCRPTAEATAAIRAVLAHALRKQPPPDPEFERLATECYAALAKAVSAAGFHINARSSGEFYLTPKAQQPPPVGVTDAMVEAGLRAARDDSDARLPRYKVVRSILEAALSHQQPAPSVSEEVTMLACQDHASARAHGSRVLAAMRAPDSPDCPHEAWEEKGGGRRCSDCREYLGSTPTAPEPAASGEGLIAPRWFASGPPFHFYTDDRALAERIIFVLGEDRDEWTVTDLENPTGQQQDTPEQEGP